MNGELDGDIIIREGLRKNFRNIKENYIKKKYEKN